MFPSLLRPTPYTNWMYQLRVTVGKNTQLAKNPGSGNAKQILSRTLEDLQDEENRLHGIIKP